MPPRHVTVVVKDVPTDLAAVRGSVEQLADEGGVVLTPKPPIPIVGGWGRPVKSGNVPPLRAWGFWASTEDAATRAQLMTLRDAGIARVFIGPAGGSVHPTWKQDVGWIDRVPAVLK